MEYAPAVARRWTVQEVYNLPPDGMRHEVVYGEHLVTPAPVYRHQTVLLRLTLLLAPYLSAQGLAHTLCIGPLDFFVGKDVYLVPDLAVAHPDDITGDWRDLKRLRLVVEVLSPSSVRADREVKRRVYQRAGAEMYWIVDPEARAIERWQPADTAPSIERVAFDWSVTPEAPPLRVDVPALFDGVI